MVLLHTRLAENGLDEMGFGLAQWVCDSVNLVAGPYTGGMLL